MLDMFLLSLGQVCSSCNLVLCNCNIVYTRHRSAQEQTVALLSLPQFRLCLDLAPLMNPPPTE